ncbi:MAG: hypothetical protein J6R18_02750, partial [Kiritimatiellae bacterium]|nr:hypothetical protein [Kiritimatiellia bacterium]
ATKKNGFKRIVNSNYLYGWLLCGAMVFSGFLPVSATETVSPYAIEGTVLKITIPEGMTNEVDVLAVACANKNEITEIRKLGRGGFLMNDKTAIPNYTGDIYVAQGTWIVASSNALGRLDFDSKGEATHGENVGKVYVADGASIDMASNDRYLNNKGKKITIKGHGVSGKGALTVSVDAANYYNDVLGNNLVLTGDSSIWMPKKFNLYLLNSIINLNGYKLTVRGDASTGSIVVGSDATVASGTLEFVNKGSLVLQGKTTFDHNCNLVFKDDSKLAVKSNDRCDAPIVWNTAGAVTSEQRPKGDNFTNILHGAVQLDKTMRVGITKNGSFGLAGTVTGVGGLNMFWNEQTIPEVPTNVVTLANAESTFEGGLILRNLIVKVKEDGDVHAEGGVFALTNSIANFAPLKKYMLPDGIIHVTGERSVTGGMGKWKTLVKTGSGTVNYDSAIGAEVLDLREGVLKVSMQPSTYAGLIEGVEYFESTDECQKAAKNKDIAYTNGVVNSPYLMNTAMHTYWTTERPAWDTERKISANCTTYSGYIWNREPTTVRWTFACNVANITTLHFDNELKFSHSTQSGTPIKKVTFEVTPGWHSIRIGNYAAYKGNQTTQGGYSTSSSDKDWKSNGLRWDRLGRDTIDPANFEILEDPGDGSLLTWAIPGEEVFYPGTEMLIEQIKFYLVKFTGGTLHLNEITNTVTEAEGIPLVAGTGKLIIESKWTVDAAEIANAEVSGLSFGFGADAELEIENSSAARSMTGSREWTVIKSAEDITGSITVKDEDMAKRWSVKVDGNEVKLKYRPFGTAVIIR